MIIASMQGRLVPPVGGRIQCFPVDGWADEFPLAAAAELDAIEWIDDVAGINSNPIRDDEGIKRIQALSDQHGVQVRSLCADYFMERPFVRATRAEVSERRERLIWLLDRCGAVGIRRVVLPFVDASRIESADDLEVVVGVLESLVSVMERTGVEIHLETSLDPSAFAKLLRRLQTSLIKVNYDSGNSASLGYRPDDEFAAYGDRVGSVHIKDRIQNGVTVPLGTGDTDFAALFRCLDTVGYRGDYVLQAARGESGEEVAWASKNRDFLLAGLRGNSWISA